MEKIISKILYAILFCVLLPIGLVFWANETSKFIKIPVPNLPFLSVFLIIVGLFFIIASMGTLWFKGKGLPMNAFPPKKFVTSNLYKYFHHPIYIGAILCCLGFSLYYQSSSGLWLITPIFTLMIIAYVLGFENEIIFKAFSENNFKTFFDLPSPNLEKIALKNKILLYFWIYIPWLIIYSAFIFIGIPNDYVEPKLSIDHKIPYISSAIFIYLFIYIWSVFIPFILISNQQLNHFVRTMIIGMIIIFLCYICFPFVVLYADIQDNSLSNFLLNLDRQFDGQSASLPSFHVFWSFISYYYFSKKYPKLKVLFLSLAVAISISCVLVKNHYLLDILFGFLVYLVSIYHSIIYIKILGFFEKISNSWQEVRIGKFRIINHGIYAGIGGFFGFLIMSYFMPNQIFWLFCIGLSGIFGALFWGQFIEGSPMLLRPYGYYGSLFGVGLTVLLISYFSSISIWELLGVSAIAAPIIQCFGRLRCLVQGCCHGKICGSPFGIRFYKPNSRVVKLANWQGKLLYPTQVYSIASNFVIFFILIRMVSLEMPSSFICGLYLILNGLSRFVEEYFRGEPQTPFFAGMRVYQWIALISIFMGIIFTCVNSKSLPHGYFTINNLFYSLIFGFIVFCAYGVDLPNGKFRFSRLTS